MIINFLSNIPCIKNFNIFEFYPRIENGIVFLFYAYFFYTIFNINSIINNKIKHVIFFIIYNVGIHSKLS